MLKTHRMPSCRVICTPSLEGGYECYTNCNTNIQIRKELFDTCGKEMATSSFDEMMMIDTPEKKRNLEAAYYAALERGPLVFDGPSIDELLKESEEFLKNNPNWLKEAAAKAKERILARGEELPDPIEE